MKTSFALLFIVAISLGANAQTQTIYYNSQWEMAPQEEASYYRLCQLDTGKSIFIRRWFIGKVEDFSMDGKLLMTGFYTSGKPNGVFVFYYTNGQVQAKGNFKHGYREGLWKYFFTNGTLEREIDFSTRDDLASLKLDFTPITVYDSAGKPLIENGTGIWHFEYEWYGMTDRYIIDGKFENGKKEGLWTCTLSNGKVLYRELYKKDKFKEGFLMVGEKREILTYPVDNKFMLPCKFEVTENFLIPKDRAEFSTIKSTGDSTYRDTIPDNEKLFYAVEQQAEFPGGHGAMMKFVSATLRYPKEARQDGASGRVFVKFVVEKDGSISNIEILKGVHKLLNIEAIRVVSLFPMWKPGKQNGQLVRSQFVLPITFNIALVTKTSR